MKRNRSPSPSIDEPSGKKSKTTPSQKHASETNQSSPLDGQSKAATAPARVTTPAAPSVSATHRDNTGERPTAQPVKDGKTLPDATAKTTSTDERIERPRKRSLSPAASRETPRPRKRPGGAARIDHAAKEVVLQRQQAREEEAKVAAATRGVHDVVRQHYNAVPQRGREWRKTDSRIKGLRGFNNWVKSTIIHKFSPNADNPGTGEPLLVLDLGCGKGGDLAKWAQAPQDVALYVGIDPAEVSIDQARERYAQMSRPGGRGGRGGMGGRGGYGGGRPQRTFDAEFIVQDAFGESIGNIPIVRNVGFDAKGGSRWGGGGFDVVSMMFCMHYAFENEAMTRGMLLNIAGALKKGGRFIGTMPNSDILREKVTGFHKQQALHRPKPLTNGTAKAAAQAVAEGNGGISSTPQTSATEAEPSKARIPTPDIADNEVEDEAVAHWGNSIYQVRFPGKTPQDGIFRPPFGWKYNYFLDEAVEVPEYVVPWEAFRA